MAVEKTCSKVVFYCGVNSSKTYNGKPLYDSWPKLPHHDGSGARRWAEGYRSKVPCLEIETPNSFKDAIIYDDVDSRGQSAKVPSAVVYNKEHDCYLKFDFRTDGMVELLINGSVSKGVIKSEMAFRYAGSNYFFVRKDSQEFKDFEKTFAPKGKKKTTSKVDVGVPFYGSFNDIMVYLGKFKCTEDKDECTYTPSYENEMVHVYQRVGINYEWRNDVRVEDDDKPTFVVNKSKMNVKGLVDPKDKCYNDLVNAIVKDSLVESEYITKGSYGPSTAKYDEMINFIYDASNSEVKITTKKIPSRGGPCGGHPLGSFGISGLFK